MAPSIMAWLRLATAVLGVAAPVAGALAGADSPYLLQPGDTVELTVAGLPELRSRAMIDIDGSVRLPLIQTIAAGGRTLDDLKAQVQRLLPQKGFRQRTPEGREFIVVVSADEINLNVSEYRPVYVRGDVAKPGQQPFRPGLTVRQVIALAGGYDVMRFHMENPFLESADLRARYQTLWIDLARRETHAAALKAKIEGAPMPDLAKTASGPLPKAVLSELADVEMQHARVQADDAAKETAFLEKSAADAQSNAAALLKPKSDAERSEREEADYKSKLSELLDKGYIARTRIADQQKTMLESTQRFLSYNQRIQELQQTSSDFSRKARHAEDGMRATLLKDLEDTRVEIASIKANLGAVEEKLVYTGAIRSQLVRGSGSRPDIEVCHVGEGAASVRADEDTVLTAGDTVEISLRAEMTPGGLSN